jgi:hypothetical protein
MWLATYIRYDRLWWRRKTGRKGGMVGSVYISVVMAYTF